MPYELYHHGILGMHWGVHRSSEKEKAYKKQLKKDAHQYNKIRGKVINYEDEKIATESFRPGGLRKASKRYSLAKKEEREFVKSMKAKNGKDYITKLQKENTRGFYQALVTSSVIAAASVTGFAFVMSKI